MPNYASKKISIKMYLLISYSQSPPGMLQSFVQRLAFRPVTERLALRAEKRHAQKRHCFF